MVWAPSATAARAFQHVFVYMACCVFVSLLLHCDTSCTIKRVDPHGPVLPLGSVHWRPHASLHLKQHRKCQTREADEFLHPRPWGSFDSNVLFVYTSWRQGIPSCHQGFCDLLSYTHLHPAQHRLGMDTFFWCESGELPWQTSDSSYLPLPLAAPGGPPAALSCATNFFTKEVCNSACVVAAASSCRSGSRQRHAFFFWFPCFSSLALLLRARALLLRVAGRLKKMFFRPPLSEVECCSMSSPFAWISSTLTWRDSDLNVVARRGSTSNLSNAIKCSLKVRYQSATNRDSWNFALSSCEIPKRMATSPLRTCNRQGWHVHGLCRSGRGLWVVDRQNTYRT